jgi:hypothetical protein
MKCDKKIKKLEKIAKRDEKNGRFNIKCSMKEMSYARFDDKERVKEDEPWSNA